MTQKKSVRAKKTASKKILSPGEPPPFRVENPRGKGQGLIVCDHASNRVPQSLKDMGLKKADLKKHIAWDIGCEEITRHMAKALDMPAVLACYSRLVTDLNRAPHYHECIIEVSDHIRIPVNNGLSKEDKARRYREIYWPYQREVGRRVDGLLRKKHIPVVISVHSMTPVLDGKKRPWHISVLWHKEEKLAKKIVRQIRKNHPDLLVGENEPYTLFNERFAGSTICHHAEERGLPYVFVEFRQDLVDTREKARLWADIFLQALVPVLADAEIYLNRKIKPRKK